MQAASVIPVWNASAVDRDPYKMALAHLMAVPAFGEYREAHAGSEGSFVVMDNGVVETGTPMPPTDLLALAHDNRIDEVVMPDLIGEHTRTLAMSKSFLIRYREYVEQGRVRPLRLMAVPQGEDTLQWADCLRQMLKWPEVTTIGISRFATHATRKQLLLLSRDLVLQAERERKAERREQVEWKARTEDGGVEVHILGCHEPISYWQAPSGENDLPDDDLFWLRVRGIDSSLPAVYTASGRVMSVDSRRPEQDALNLSLSRLDPVLLNRNKAVWAEEMAKVSWVTA